MNYITFLAATADDAAMMQANSTQSMIVTFGSLAIMLLLLYFMMIRPEKKRAKKMKEMLDNLQVADEVVTTGGIIGRVLSVKEDTVLLETGGDRTRIRILRSSIAENRTVHEEADTNVIKK